MKTKVNVVRGTPLYKYKSSYVLSPPSGSYIKEMIYDSEKNCTEIILKKHTMITELLCTVILVSLFIIKFLNFNSVNTIYFDSSPLYYNNSLYLNMETSEENFSPFEVSLYDYNGSIIDSKVLNINEDWVTVECDYQKEYILELSTKNILGITKDKKCKLSTVLMTAEE